MNRVNGTLFSANVTGTLAWIADAQSFFGLIGAVAGAVSGIMLIAINWDRFVASKPVQWLARKFEKRQAE